MEIEKLNYFDLLEFSIKNENISCKLKNQIVNKLLEYKKYLDYIKYFEEIKWLDKNDRNKFIESLINSDSSQLIYFFSITLKNNLSSNEVYNLFNGLYSYNNNEYTYNFINEFFSFLKDKINEIIDKICKDKNYSLLIEITDEYRNYLTDSVDNIVKTISESYIVYYIFKLLNLNVGDKNTSLLIESICNINDVCYICDSIRLINNKLSASNMDNILSSYDRTLNFNIVKTIVENCISNLSEENIDLIINDIFKTPNKENIIYFVIKLYNYFTKKQIEIIIDFAIKTNDYEILFNVSEILKDKIDKEKVSKVSKEIIKSDNIYYIYKFLYVFKDKLPKQEKNRLASKIINSKEMKFIILVSVFIDIKLVEKLFKSKKNLFIYAVSLNIFTIEEIDAILKKLDIKKDNLQFNNIPKKYRLKRNDK